MSELEQVLQQHIEQLEAGEPVEACLAGLPEQEMDALRLIASMRTMPVDDASSESIAAQRTNILEAASAQLNGGAPAAPPSFAASFLAQLRVMLDRLRTQRELAIGLAALLVVVILGLAWRGIGQKQNSENIEIAAPATNSSDEETTSELNTPFTPPAGTESEADAVASVPDVPQGPAIYLPMLAISLERTPQTAIVEDVQGIVEIQTEADTWTAVNRAATIAVGQRVRTGELSQASITFYDGSQAYLNANTEISIDELNALSPEEGFRTVVMTQWIGNSDHSVQFRNDGGSRYEVKTPDGSGLARGTKFRVLVTPDLLTQYTVTEGKVDVTGLNRTVSVTAGQMSTFTSGNPPEDPAFTISGEGEVAATGSLWTIAGQTFQTHEHTVIIGNPQIGDLAHVDGHLLPDGERVADRISLLRRAVTNQFVLSGEVETIGATWAVAGQTILIDGNTEIDEDIAVGDRVRIEGVVLPDSSLLAEEIELVDKGTLPGLPFSFQGIVQTIGGESWTISGVAVAIDEETTTDDDITIGDVVAVDGWILDDSTWLARHIEQVEDDDELPTFAITGRVQSIDPWLVAGIAFETREWTVIEPEIAVGDLVRVRGTILENGTWIAATITEFGDNETGVISLVGIVNSIDPWVVNGLQLFVTPTTLIIGDVAVGDLVLVKIQLSPDGTWRALRIQPLYPHFGHGCLIFSSPVVAVSADAIQVKHWHVDIKRDGRIKIHGDIKVNSVITLPLCTGWDGTIIIIGDITVIYQPIIIIIDNGGGAPPGGSHKGSKKS